MSDRNWVKSLRVTRQGVVHDPDCSFVKSPRSTAVKWDFHFPHDRACTRCMPEGLPFERGLDDVARRMDGLLGGAGISDFVEFLTARLDEDASAANDAVKTVMNGSGVWDRIHPDIVSYVVRYVPARVLADVESKRRIIALWQVYGEAMLDAGRSPTERLIAAVSAAAVLDSLGYLIQPYADHPDFRDEWH